MLGSLRSTTVRHSQSLCRPVHRFFSTKELIINAVGTDRLGIVSDMTKYVTDVGGSVGESQASKLGNYFSLMMLVHVPESHVVTLVDQLEEIEDITATVHMVKPVSKTQPISKAAIGYTGKFILEGADNLGIVYKVTSVLAKSGLSIDRMETSDSIAPHGGTTLFRMSGTAHAYEPKASSFDAEKIRAELRTLGDELNCDIDLIDS